MAIPKLTPLPPAPSQDDTEEEFVALADASLTAQQGMVAEINQMLDQLNPVLLEIQSASANASAAAKSAKAAQDAQAAAEAAAGNPIRLGLLHAVALCF